jgi:hypothetical protein
MPWVSSSADFEEEPCAPFRFVDPGLNEAGRRDIAVLVTNIVCLAQPGGERLIVLAQLGQHVQRLDVVRVVIQNALEPGDVADKSSASNRC